MNLKRIRENWEISLKFDQIRWWIEIRNYEIYDIKKDNTIANPQNKKSSDLDYYSQSNQSLKMEEKLDREIDLKPKLNWN